MIKSIAAYKESLSRLANGVLDTADELEIPPSRGGSIEDSPASGPRLSQRSARFASPVAGSPTVNGIGTDPLLEEIAKCKAEVQRHQTSEAEAKELAFSYAAALKENEVRNSKLQEENASLKKKLMVKGAGGHSSRDESPKPSSNNSKVPLDRSPIRLHRNTPQGSSRSENLLEKNPIAKHDGYNNGCIEAFPFDDTSHNLANSPGNGKDYEKLFDEVGSLVALKASHESEIKKLKAQLDSERENSSTINLKLQEECQLKDSSQRELQDLKIQKERTLIEMKELQEELRDKISELRQLQAAPSRRDMEDRSDEFLENMKGKISTLERENSLLKTEKNELEASLKLQMKSVTESAATSELRYMDNNISKLNERKIEEMETSMQKLEKALERTAKERDKAVQELDRLKQHLLDKADRKSVV